MVSDLILGCANLESLVLEYCYDMKELKICSSRLKSLSLLYFHSQNEEEESVEICAPNLVSFRIVCFEMWMYSLKETGSLVEAYVEFMHEERHYKYWSKVVRFLTGVKHLVVENWWFRVSSFCLSPLEFHFGTLISILICIIFGDIGNKYIVICIVMLCFFFLIDIVMAFFFIDILMAFGTENDCLVDVI